MHEILTEWLRARVGDDAWRWLDDACRTALSGPPREGVHSPESGAQARVLRAYTAAPRKVGRAPLALTPREQASIATAAPGVSMARWSLDDLARAVLLLSLAGRPDFTDLATACFEQGDSREQQSWLRGLPLLPAPERFLPLSIDACRTNIVPVFESIACENPYPVRHFPERNFNQMVLKALFNAIALERIVGLTTRFNEELSRMADDYVSEREAAGRPVPQDIWLVLAPRVAERALPRVRRYLNDTDPAHRRWAAEGLRYR